MEIFKEYSELAEFAEHYKKDYLSIYKSMVETANKVMYSTGGQSIHRGYYCPSPTADVIVGNVNRGKLLVRLTSKSKPSYKYYFDKNNMITVVDNFTETGKSVELIISDGTVERSVVFDSTGEIILLTKCGYSEKKLTYYNKFAYSGMLPLQNSDDAPYMDFTGEKYEYGDQGIKRVDIRTYMSMPQSMFGSKIEVFRHFAAEFSHDDDGFLSAYKYFEYGNNEMSERIIRVQDFKVNVKRKV